MQALTAAAAGTQFYPPGFAKRGHILLIELAKTSEEAENLKRKGGRLSKRELGFYQATYTALRDKNVDEKHASVIANALTRMRPSSVAKLVGWKILNAETEDLINLKAELPVDALKDLTTKIIRFIDAYKNQEFTDQQIDAVLQSLYPPQLSTVVRRVSHPQVLPRQYH